VKSFFLALASSQISLSFSGVTSLGFKENNSLKDSVIHSSSSMLFASDIFCIYS
jgi:hypothetical protein